MTDLSVGAEFAGYRLEAVAGRGGMGVVYRARNLITDQLRAVKVIAPEFSTDPQFRERFKRESRLAARLEHPNVIPLHEAREEGDRLYLVMRYVDGSDLASVINREGRLPVERAVSILSQVAAALDAAHGQGLVHRDVKPANVLLDRVDGREHAYLTDFGLVKDLSADSSITTAGTFMGTYQYAAPEQIDPSGLDRIDGRVDVYALGCVLYHALAGQVPFPRDSVHSLIAAHLFMDPPDVRERRPDVPPGLTAVIHRAMAKDRNQRFSMAGELAAAAHAAMHTAAPPSPPIQAYNRPGDEPTDWRTTSGGEPSGGSAGDGRTVATGDAADPDRTAVAEHAASGRGKRVPLIAGALALALVVVVAGALLLAGAGGDSGAARESSAGRAATTDEGKIRQAVEKFSTSSDPAVCELGTQAFHERVWGGSGPNAIEACRTELPRLRRSGQVSIQSIDISGASAAAEITWGDGEEGKFTLIDTAEGWRLNDYVLSKRGSNTQKRR